MIPEVSLRTGMPGIERQPAFRFGVFELDSRARQLRKHGVKLKLQDQPLQILALLLSRPGELVTREEIQKQLWPEGTYVDFENAINSAIRKLRGALGDSASNPRFIETVSRRGYRFVASLWSRIVKWQRPPKDPTIRPSLPQLTSIS
jgi:cholera toxin transcriptional activator